MSEVLVCPWQRGVALSRGASTQLIAERHVRHNTHTLTSISVIIAYFLLSVLPLRQPLRRSCSYSLVHTAGLSDQATYSKW
mmetsp:Transcript_11089/g.23531  ORF Transcript_11089/g.23531 Transcript_11089/m.23531 type:complete len:81 (-) Transcript_11089:172-414(-)